MVPGPMDDNGSPRGRHRHRTHPGGPAGVDSGTQWTLSSDGPQWSVDERVRRARQAVAWPRPEDDQTDWFAPLPADQPGLPVTQPPADRSSAHRPEPDRSSAHRPEPDRGPGTAATPGPPAADPWRGTGASAWPRPADRAATGRLPRSATAV